MKIFQATQESNEILTNYSWPGNNKKILKMLLRDLERHYKIDMGEFERKFFEVIGILILY